MYLAAAGAQPWVVQSHGVTMQCSAEWNYRDRPVLPFALVTLLPFGLFDHLHNFCSELSQFADREL